MGGYSRGPERPGTRACVRRVPQNHDRGTPERQSRARRPGRLKTDAPPLDIGAVFSSEVSTKGPQAVKGLARKSKSQGNFCCQTMSYVDR